MKRLLIAACVCVAVIIMFMALSTAGAETPITTTTVSTTTSTTLDPAAVQKWNEAVWFAAVAENERKAQEEAQAKAQAAAKAQQAQRAKTQQRQSSPRSSGGLVPAQNGCAIPSYICARESNNTLNAKNPNSTASGKYQFLDSTWAGYGGYAHASDAPESVQDAKASELWNGGRGCSHWSAC